MVQSGILKAKLYIEAMSEKIQALREKLNLRQVPDKRDWVLRKWEVYLGQFYLGSILKRKAGNNTPLKTHQSPKKIFQCQILLFLGENQGLTWEGSYPETLSEAKSYFAKKFYKLSKLMYS